MKRAPTKKQPSKASLLMWTHLNELARSTRVGNYMLDKEHRFSSRRWRFDFALIACGKQLGIEIDGAVWTQGRHTRGSGYVKDLEKFNHASGLYGWRVLHFTPQQVLDGSAIAFIRRVLES